MKSSVFLADVTTHLSALVRSGMLQGWTLRSTTSRSHQQLYSSPDGITLSCHQSRRVKGDAFQLSIYTPAAETDQVGTAMLDLVPFKAIGQQLDEALELAAGSKNKSWSLAGPPEIPPPEVETCDPEIRDHPARIIESIETQFSDAFAAASGCRLNSAELFVNYSISSIRNSKGLHYSIEQSELYLEAAMEKSGGENDKEVHEYATAVTANDLDVKGFVDGCALQVSVLGESEEPETSDSAIILIDKDALSQMLQAILEQLNCTNEYLKRPFLRAGDVFGGGKGDALELKLDPTLPGMVLSSAYAADGLPARSGLLIGNNTIKDRVVGNRFGQYLNLDPNGMSGNLIVQPGRLTKESLKGLDYIEVIKFSSLLIDARKLTWSSEIKLGRHSAADGTLTLVKGGVVSGSLKENFTDCRLSSTLGSVNVPPSSYAPALGYRGPDAMLITRGVSIAGKSEGEI